MVSGGGAGVFFYTFSIIFATSFRTFILADFCVVLAIGPSTWPLRWPHFCIPKHLKIASKIDLVFDALSGASCPVLARFFVPTWSRKSIKLLQKSMPRNLLKQIPFSHRFVFDFCFQLRSPKLDKSIKMYRFHRIFRLLGAFKIRSIFDPIFMPTWLDFHT